MRLTLSRRREIAGFLFVSPWIFGFIVFLASPLIQSFTMMFKRLDDIDGFKMSYIGVENFRKAFLSDTKFLPLLGATLRNAILDVPIILVFSMITAFLVSKRLRGSSFFKTIFFLPVVVASGVVVQRLFNQGVGSVENSVQSLSFAGTLRMADYIFLYLGPDAARWFLDIVGRLTMVLWRSGVQILLFIAGFQGISQSYYEAAKVDGASDWEVFWKVTLPLLSPIIVVNIIFTIVDGFTDPFNGVLTYVRDTAFRGTMSMGYAAALGWIYFVVIFALIAAVLIWSRKWVFYVGEK